jgi:pimeloyl-ACP methyl ester carboxylesterase
MALRLALDAPEVVHSLVLLDSERVSIWPRWGELQERLCECLPQTELFVLPGANHALEEKDPRGVAEAAASRASSSPICRVDQRVAGARSRTVPRSQLPRVPL